MTSLQESTDCKDVGLPVLWFHNHLRRQKNERAFKSERKRWSAVKKQKPLRDPAYLEFIRGEYCVLCLQYGSETGSRAPQRTEAAHVGERGLGQKCSDRETIPLCRKHHLSGPDSHHRMGKQFWKHHKLDRADLIRHYNELYEQETLK